MSEGTRFGTSWGTDAQPALLSNKELCQVPIEPAQDQKKIGRDHGAESKWPTKGHWMFNGLFNIMQLYAIASFVAHIQCNLDLFLEWYVFCCTSWRASELVSCLASYSTSCSTKTIQIPQKELSRIEVTIARKRQVKSSMNMVKRNGRKNKYEKHGAINQASSKTRAVEPLLLAFWPGWTCWNRWQLRLQVANHWSSLPISKVEDPQLKHIKIHFF